MKKKALLFGALPAMAIASGLFLYKSTESKGSYEQRLSSHLDAPASSIEGTYEYYHQLKGDFTKADWERARALSMSITQDRTTFNWYDQGPDNVGGRTRAIVVDRNNINHLYAGSVSGGLYESNNRGNLWSKVDEFAENLAISSMCQTVGGTFFAATGHQAELNGGSQNAYDSGANGYGLYKLNTDGTWVLIPGTEDYSYINEVVADDVNNVVFIACNQGLMKYDVASSTLSEVSSYPAAAACNSLSISKDGLVLIAHAVGGGPSAVLTSTDGGASFTDVSDPSVSDVPGKIALGGVGRIEFAISHEKVDGKYRVYGAAAAGNLRGMWRSTNDGLSWVRIAPAADGDPGEFDPYTSGGSGQGLYDNIITVVPGAPDKIIVGGIDCYTWDATGNWEQVSQWFLSPTNPNYVHADNHEMTWDSEGRLYIGNDGGISISDNAGSSSPEFYPANRGYAVTQFYAMGVSAHGDVIAGAQDNGVQANYHTGTTWREFKEVGGGDGFSANISFINRNIMFGSVYYSSVYRSSDRGENGSVFIPPFFLSGSSPCTIGDISGEGCGQFFTNFEMWEHPNDLESTDSLRYIPTEEFSIGDIIDVPSAVSQTFIKYTCPINVVFDDTLEANPGLTYNDTIAKDEITGGSFNLGLLDWEFIFGASAISIGDSILIHGVDTDDTIIVESINTIDHYIGTNPAKPGLFVDMGNNEEVYDVAWDTLIVQDPYQAWFALDMGGANGVWMTRNSLRFSAQTQGWFKAFDGVGDVASMEFSKNGDYLFIGTWSGGIYRYSGFNDAYSPTALIEGATIGGITYDTLVDNKGNKIVTQLKQIGSLGAPITGLASGPIGDPDYLVVTLGNYSGTGKVRESLNATALSPTFTAFGSFPGSGEGASGIGIPCYSVIVDRDNANIIVVGTEFGVFASENGGTTWANVSGALGNVPVYDMQQNWRTWNEGCKRPGEIYLGTHGAGIWSSDAFLSLPGSDNLAKDKFIPNLKLYPNPVSESGTIEFELEENGDVTLQIFNLNGQVVREVKANNLNAGKNLLAFDAQDLSKGTYILRLTSGTLSETTKFIKK